MSDYEHRFIRFTLSLEKTEKALQRCKNVRMATLGLRGGHVMCLCQLRSEEKGLTSAELARRCEVDRAFISRTVAELTKAGCISPLKKNSRSRLTLTATGMEVADQVHIMMQKGVEAATKDVTEEELEVFYRVMHKLEANINALEQNVQESTQKNKGELNETAKS